ncbi:MAG: arsenate reductase [Saprospiraceae bacterium]|nr:arsenate reductase [Saprospiraceae bacterium]
MQLDKPKGKYPFYYLKSCDTCLKILKTLPQENLILINIKDTPPDEKILNTMVRLAGSYESLFNFRAQLLKDLPPEDKPVKEEDFKKHLLEHYTYLKRPVTLVGNKIFIGNAPETTKLLSECLKNS